MKRISRHRKTLAKKNLKLYSPFSITSWNFWGPGLWIPTKGVLYHPNMDWPCQDFTQGSTREQPRAEFRRPHLLSHPSVHCSLQGCDASKCCPSTMGPKLGSSGQLPESSPSEARLRRPSSAVSISGVNMGGLGQVLEPCTLCVLFCTA